VTPPLYRDMPRYFDPNSFFSLSFFMEVHTISHQLWKTHMTPIKVLDIKPLLLSQGICSGEASANATMVYVFMWMEGQSFDLSKSAVKVHRARLRKIGLDIGKPYAGEVVSSSF
ncbi:hypothetical protein ALP11_02813, partial [Pseudomonas syringae pv. papulans]